MAGPTAVEQDRRTLLEPWVVGDTAHNLMGRLSQGIVSLKDYPQAAGVAYAEPTAVSPSITEPLSFSEGPVGYKFLSRRSLRSPLDEGGRTMYLEIKDGTKPSVNIALEAAYRMGLGLYDGNIIIIDRNPAAEKLPANTIAAADRIREIFDQYLPLETQTPRAMRDDAFIGDSLAQ